MAQKKPVTVPDTEESSEALDILRASIAGYFTRQRTRLKEARKDLKVDHCTIQNSRWLELQIWKLFDN